jgi:phage I-like protein
VIDYEHATLKAKENGQAAPAAGWFKKLVWRDGQGLFLTDARWTDQAKAMVKTKEYRYVSPVFTYHPTTGEVLSLINLALTNDPALSGLTDLGTLAINSAGATAPLEARCRAEWDRNPALRGEFAAAGFGAYLALCRHEPRHAPR